MAATPPPSSESFGSLSTYAVIFSALSALFGAYFVLFVLAIWGTYRHTGTAYKRLRWVTILLFVVECIHYIARAVSFGRSRLETPPADELAKRGIPLTFITILTTTIAGTLSDGLLAWRFYVIYDRYPHALSIPSILITINTMLGLSGNFQYLAYYRHQTEFQHSLVEVTFEINVLWGWCMLGINTLLSGGMIWKIIRVSFPPRTNRSLTRLGQYAVVVEAIAESALVTWVGLVLYGVGSLAPHGRITTGRDIGFVMGCILPMFFGISQCLMAARLGFALDGQSPSDAEVARSIGVTYQICDCQRSGRVPKGIAIMVKRETETVSMDGHGVIINEEKSRIQLSGEEEGCGSESFPSVT